MNASRRAWALANLATATLLPACSTASSETPDAPADFVTVELTTVGLDPEADAPVVLLRDAESGRVLPIWVGLPEAQAIARTLHGIEMARPMTHDLLANVLRDLGAVVREVRVSDLREETYYGAIVLRPRDQNRDVEVDSRPSDAMALALRTGAAIRVARQLLEQAPDINFIAPDEDEQVVQALGLVVVAPTQELRESFGLPDRPGVVVSRAFGEALDAGLQRGDMIVEVNGNVPAAPMDFFESVRGSLPGTPVKLRFWRKGEERTVDLMPRRLEPATAERPRART